MTEQVYVRKPNFVTRRVAGETVVVPVLGAADGAGAQVSPGGERLDFLVLNEAGELLWARLSSGASLPDLARELMTAYGIAREAAEHDAAAFVASLLEIHALSRTE